jgi:hypothetical protein
MLIYVKNYLLEQFIINQRFLDAGASSVCYRLSTVQGLKERTECCNNRLMS